MKPSGAEAFSVAYRKLMKEKGVTFQRAGESVGASKGTVHAWLNGNRYPRKKFEALCGLVGLDWRDAERLYRVEWLDEGRGRDALGGAILPVEAELLPIEKIVRESANVRIIRSGYAPHIATEFIDLIGAACASKTAPTRIRIITSSTDNPDIQARCSNFMPHLRPDEARRQLDLWVGRIGELQRGMAARPEISIELRQTDLPHRYHGFAGERNYSWA